MDFPMFHLDWLNDRFLIAVIAILHVLINHGLAVGFIPYITWLEYKGVRNAPADQITDFNWDNLVQKKMRVAFIITTTVGAMTGVGIWFSVALVSPASIGSLIRVFYWAWFTEWIVFVTEVILIMIYYLTWKNANRTLKSKLRHIRFGWFLSIASWITMTIIVSILGFMMDPGNWNTHKSLFNGFTNPIYLPQLSFRTPAAMLLAGVFGMLLTTLFTRRGDAIRAKAVKYSGRWILFWTPFLVAGSLYYWSVLPAAMKENMSTAVGTLEFAQYYNLLRYFILATVSCSVLLALWAVLQPRRVNLATVLLPCLLTFGFIGIFERVREFVRKPYVIGGYMYSNLLRVEDYPLYQRDGILKYATYTTVHKITPENRIEAGRNIFMLTCSRCHTNQGINAVTDVFEKMYGKGKVFEEQSLASFIKNMHMGRTFMPPFPGNDQELEALAAYIKNIQQTGESLLGAQSEGVTINPLNNTAAAAAELEQQQSALQADTRKPAGAAAAGPVKTEAPRPGGI